MDPAGCKFRGSLSWFSYFSRFGGHGCVCVPVVCRLGRRLFSVRVWVFVNCL